MSYEEWPEPGEYVVATVTRIVPYGAYVRLEEYDGKEGFVHISEISSSWVRNIRNFLREGQQAVFIVVRVDRRRGHVDLSLKRTSERDARAKLLEWKRSKKARFLLEIAASRIKRPLDDLYEEFIPLIEDEFGTVYNCFEAAAKEGLDALKDLDLPDDLKRALAEIAKESIRIRRAKIIGTLQLTCLRSNGVSIIREAIRRAKEVGDVNVYVIGCPNFRIEVQGDNYKEAEATLRKAVESAISYIKREGGQGSFSRAR